MSSRKLSTLQPLLTLRTQRNAFNLLSGIFRYPEGLMAAYDLSGKEVLLEKAIIIGDILYGAFETHNHMPCFSWPQ